MRRLAPAAVALAMTVAFFHQATLGGRIFIARDILRVYYPLHQYWAERVSRGEFPDWFPYDALGEPLPGTLIAGVFHPANLLYLAFPLGTAMTINVLACFPLAFGGAFLFARRWGMAAAAAALTGVLYAFGGYLVSITNNLAYLMAAASFPVALWGCDRFFAAPTLRRAGLAAFLLALVLLAGDPQSFVIACGLAVVVGGMRRPRRTAAAAILLLVLTGLVAAVQLVPALQVAAEGKPASQTLAAAEAWSLHPLRVLDLALGPLFASESGDQTGAAIGRALLATSRNNLWVDSLHLGIPALVLAGVALVVYRRSARTWVLVACAVALALLALGRNAPLYGLVFRLLPPWRAFRYPEKLAPYVIFALALGAGVGLDAVQSDERVRRRAAVALGMATVVCVTMVVLERTAGVFSRGLVPVLWNGVPPREALVRLSATFTGVAGLSIVVGVIPATIPVIIDIKPGSLDNTVNPTSQGRIPVAILSGPSFNAPTVLDPTSLTFGRTGNEKSLTSCSSEDVNGDRLPDLVCHFNTPLTGLQIGDAQCVLKGKTTSNIRIQGTDSVRLVP